MKKRMHVSQPTPVARNRGFDGAVSQGHKLLRLSPPAGRPENRNPPQASWNVASDGVHNLTPIWSPRRICRAAIPERELPWWPRWLPTVGQRQEVEIAQSAVAKAAEY